MRGRVWGTGQVPAFLIRPTRKGKGIESIDFSQQVREGLFEKVAFELESDLIGGS